MMLLIDQQKSDGALLGSFELPVWFARVHPRGKRLNPPVGLGNGNDLADRHPPMTALVTSKVKPDGSLEAFLDLDEQSSLSGELAIHQKLYEDFKL